MRRARAAAVLRPPVRLTAALLCVLPLLVIAENSFGVDGAASVAEGIRSCVNLHTLIVWSEYSHGAQTSSSVPHLTDRAATLAPGNNIGDRGAVALGKALRGLTRLGELNCQGESAAAHPAC